MESLVNYQTMIADLTGMPIAQSSLLVRLFSTKAQFIALMLLARTLLSCGFPASVNP